MKEGLRQSMAWLHTWGGLLLGWLLFAIFFTGTLSYFKAEITHWMQPEAPARALNADVSLDLAQRYLEQHGQGAQRWFIDLPDPRQPLLAVAWQAPSAPGERGVFTEKLLDPGTGSELHVRDTRGGEFFYRFHFQLQMPYPWGRWLSTMAAMVMFVALISGIITHKKIFKDFFTFRPRKGQRTWLDGHNAVGVLVLPFHLMITYSSLVIFMSMVMPASILVAYKGDSNAYFKDLRPASNSTPAAGQAAPLTALDPLLKQALEHWPGGRVQRLVINHPGDANASVNVMRHSADRVVRDAGSTLSFNGVNGQLLQVSPEQSLPKAISGSFYGLHMGLFAGPLLRWLYFVCGLASTAMIGTGLVIWLGKRQLKHAKCAVQPFELRLVEILNIASMAGLVLAVAAFFWSNRLLPAAFAERADWEVNSFFWAWGLSLLHACVRPGRRAWIEQLGLGAVLFAGVPVLSVLTSPSLTDGFMVRGDWSIAGFDLACLCSGLFLAWAARKLQRAAIVPAGAKPRPPRQRPLVAETEVN